ncbi:hypothetical protein IR123_02035 [Streptococcus sp. 19428wC2_LYSM12]|uniref:hypothetical protein n=1 Tax=Streptococcus sp. 19428wC2_LYSM12 TaxID=2782470 RepID=UPI0018844B6D|nr:hypothetical protein [Streptococcus sp. 19428wC2_LYSM12]MBF0786700.1 hypothetical protein [Streptococcus sp. 19428wC2_LYSM12]
MSVLIPANICVAIIFCSIFISAYHRDKVYLLYLFFFLMNALVSLYALFSYFNLLK